MAVLATAGGLAAQEIGPPGAREAAAPKEAVTSYNGSYAYSIPIEVPDFRGIEPKLKPPMTRRAASATCRMSAAG